MSVTYRPRGVPELIDAAFQLTRRHYVPLLVLAAVTYIPTFAVLVLIGAPAATADEDALGMIGLAWIVATPLLLVWYAVGVAAMASAASEAYQGRSVDPGIALRHALSRWFTIVMACLAKWVIIGLSAAVFAIIIGVGSVLGPLVALLAIPAIALPVMFWARFFAVPTVTVLETLGVSDSLRRSAQLSDGFRWKVLGTYIVAYAIVFAISMAALVVAMLLVRNMLLAQLVSNLLSLLGFPLVGAVGVVLYYDMRIRKEGFDLELMQRELSPQSAGQPA
ncbi:MAG TPA: hypothetical protein VJ812_13570 [Gemmatimonadaceae bacterium]|jgi:hypothetical protein|nr:hypothetical protein [Gemmatimonadaceae bacterium]